MTSAASAQQLPSYIERPLDAASIFAIWPDTGVPPGAEKWAWREQTMQVSGDKVPNRMARNVVIPTVTMFKPAGATANGTSLIVAPGGAFHFLMMDHEGYDVARWLTGLGVTVFVLKYRLARTPDDDSAMPAFVEELGRALPHPGPAEVEPPVGTPATEDARRWAEEDGRQAIRFLRQNAIELGIDPDRIGIMGFSAGGGIAVNAALQYDALSRPDFVGAIYPGYRIVSPLPNDLPPLFIAIAADDKAVAPISSARLYEDWHKTGQSVELHIFANGAHGFGMHKRNLLSDIWTELFKNWMSAQGFLSPAGK